MQVCELSIKYNEVESMAWKAKCDNEWNGREKKKNNNLYSVPNAERGRSRDHKTKHKRLKGCLCWTDQFVCPISVIQLCPS